MAQNITLMGADYPDVPAVELPKTGGGTAQFTDVTDTTAIANDVANGKVFFLADGTRATGTGSGGGVPIHYGTCTTAASTTTKVVTSTTFTSEDLIAGAAILVHFSNTNSGAVGSLKLNVNDTGAKSIKYINNGSLGNLGNAGYLKADTSYLFIYDGTYWVAYFNYNSNTTYSSMTASEIAAGTGTTARLITPANLKTAVQTWEHVHSVNGETGAVVLDATDVGALPDDTVIPTNTSDLNNDSGFITSIEPLYTDDTNNSVGVGAAPTGSNDMEVSLSTDFQDADNKFANMPYSFLVSGSVSAGSYSRIASIDVNDTQVSLPIRFEIYRRFDNKTINLYLRFEDSGGTMPNVESLCYEDLSGLYNNGFSAFVYQPDPTENIYDVYVRHEQAHSWMGVNTHIPPYVLDRVEVTYSNDTLASAPSGATMATELPIVSTTKDNVIKYMPYSWIATGTDGSAGWARIATITFTVNTYHNVPIIFDIIQRNQNARLTIKYLNAGTIDPTLSEFFCDNPYVSAFIYKRTTSTWDVYVQKTENTDRITVRNVAADHWSQVTADITYVSGQESSVLSGATRASQLPIVNTAKYNRFNFMPHSWLTNGGADNAGYARIATLTHIGTYSSQPVKFTIARRYDLSTIDLYFRLPHEDSADPAIMGLYYDASASTVLQFSAFAYKRAPKTYDIYVQKGWASDWIDVWTYMGEYMQFRLDISYVADLQTSVPSGATMATVVPFQTPNADTAVVRTGGASWVNTLRLSRSGNVCELYINIKTDGTTASGSNIFTGTVNAPKPPQYITAVDYFGTNVIVATISGTTMAIRNTTPNAITSGQSLSFSFVYLSNE